MSDAHSQRGGSGGRSAPGQMDERIVELTSALVAIPTHETEEEAQGLLASWFEGCGFSCELQEVEPKRPNLIARRGSGGVFLCSHIDVHPPHDHPDPFTCRRQGDVLVGRGVLDAKGQIAALVAALEAESDAPALILFTCDEETGGRGSEVAAIPDGPWFAEGGVVLEPTGFAICTAQAGHIDVRVEVTGTSGHAYAPGGGGNPIHAVLAVIEELDTCRFLKNDHPLLGRPRTNIGRIRGGEHVWRIPGRAGLEITLGVVPGTDLADATGEVGDRLEDLAQRWDRRRTSFIYEIADASDAVEVAVDRVPVAERLARAMDEPLSPGGMPSWTDAGNLLTKHDLPCVIFGAGDLTSAHSDHETVAVADLVRLSAVLRRLLRSGGTAP